MKLLLLGLVLLLFSCAPKVKHECRTDPSLYSEYMKRDIPENFRIYGVIKYGPLKFPTLLAKFEGNYTVKVARAKDISINEERFCFKGKCYILPAPPEDLIFGRLLGGREEFYCVEGLTYARTRDRFYEKVVVFEDYKPKEISITNLKSGRSMKVLLGKESDKGFFGEIEFVMEGGEVKLLIEEVEI